MIRRMICALLCFSVMAGGIAVVASDPVTATSPPDGGKKGPPPGKGGKKGGKGKGGPKGGKKGPPKKSTDEVEENTDE